MGFCQAGLCLFQGNMIEEIGADGSDTRSHVLFAPCGGGESGLEPEPSGEVVLVLESR